MGSCPGGNKESTDAGCICSLGKAIIAMYIRNKSYRELKGRTFESLIICRLRNGKGTGAEIRPAIVSGIVTEAVKSFSIYTTT